MRNNKVKQSCGFTLPADRLAELFPFHIVFNSSREIVQLGNVWQTLSPELKIGSQVEQYFRINNPNIQLSFDNIYANLYYSFVLEFVNNGLLLKGQMVYVPDLKVIFFLCYPLIKELSSIQYFGLNSNNFGVHEPIVDFLQLLEEKNSALSDAKKLTEMLTQQHEILSEMKEQLLYDAFHDKLTSLPNRAMLMKRLGDALALSQQKEDYLFAVLSIDIDRFKVINDSLGHKIGDKLLISIARRLEACLRSGDTIARVGGDEFLIILNNIKDASYITDITERLRHELIQPFNIDEHEVFAITSIGITISTIGYQEPEAIIRDADTAMYQAKAIGNGSYQIFDKTMHAQAIALLNLEHDLRRAIERQEFELHYQPIVWLKTGKISGFEALVRWKHPEKGMISPADFIPVAEETRLIIPIGKWVLREACRQLQDWQLRLGLKTPLIMSVNISGRQFSQLDLIAQIEQILQETGIAAEHLKLEITESVLMENFELTVAMLKQLKTLGIKLSMDDFGTGYSSLSYLHRLPIDTLKIDRSFVNSLDVDIEKLEIIQTVVKLAWNLGMDVVAEGIETGQQLSHLKALRCEFGQGYFFSKPLDNKTAEALIIRSL